MEGVSQKSNTFRGEVSHKSDKVNEERVRTPIWESVKQKIQGRVSHKSDKVSGEKVKTPIWESVKQKIQGRVSHKSDKVNEERVRTPFCESVKQGIRFCWKLQQRLCREKIVCSPMRRVRKE